MTRVVITGMGCITSIGMDVDANHESLRKGVSGIRPLSVITNSVHSGVLPCGEVSLSNSELQEQLGLANTDEKYSRTALLGIIAAREAIASAKLSTHDLETTGLVSSTTVGGMDLYEDFINSKFTDGEADETKLILQDCSGSTMQIARNAGIGGYTSTISTACSSSANAIMCGADLIKAGMLDRVVVGGTDGLCKFTINGFNSLNILDGHPCRPFDESRNGLNLGEGAGFIVLESAHSAEKRGVTVLGELMGYANRNDVFHQTASSPDGDGAYAAMSDALQLAGVSPIEIDYINTHGTGTKNNDLSEGIAMKRLFGAHTPPFNSTKSYTGHTLAASGAIEAVYALLSIQDGEMYKSLRFEQPIEETNLSALGANKEKKLQYVMSNSFGFGGNCSTLVLKSAENVR